MDVTPLRIDRTARAPRAGAGAGRRVAIATLALLGLAAAGLAARYLLPLGGRGPVRVRVATAPGSSAARGRSVGGISANGYVVAARRAALSADTPGRVVELLVEEGVRVKKGALVARLFDEDAAALVCEAEAQLSVAEARRDRAGAVRNAQAAEVRRLQAAAFAQAAARDADVAEVKLAGRERKRAERLAGTGLSTDRELDQTEAALTRAKASLKRSEALRKAAEQAVEAGRARVAVAEADIRTEAASVRAAEAARDRARALHRKTEVRAPFDGLIVLKDAEIGEIVSPNVQAGGNARGAVATIVDLASLEVQADVPETSLYAVREGAPAKITLDAYPDRVYPGTVRRIWPTADRQKATVEVRVRFDEPDERLRPEMGVRVTFLPLDAAGHGGGALEGAEADADPDAAPILSIPDAWVWERAGRQGVLVVDEDTVRFQPLTLERRGGPWRRVRSGLAPGVRVVVEPSAALAPGAKVETEEVAWPSR